MNIFKYLKKKKEKYELLDGNKVDLSKISVSEKKFLEELVQMKNDGMDYYLLYKHALGHYSPVPLGLYASAINKGLEIPPLYFVVRDIVTRTGIEQGLILDTRYPEYEEAYKIFKHKQKEGYTNLSYVVWEFSIPRENLLKAFNKGEIEGEKIGNIVLLKKSSLEEYISKIKKV